MHRFQTRELAWATSGASDADAQEDSEMAGLLATSGSMLADDKAKALPSGRLDIKRLVDANAAGPSAKEINGIYLLILNSLKSSVFNLSFG